MQPVDFDNYLREFECEYRGERYSVRDNGAVLRYPPEGKRNRPADSQWTFGKENSVNPYLHISSVPVHRIVATAFHGAPPDPKHIVDHIDTNCRNNRPENLRWISRLENALKNPVTRRKIEYICGSIEAFLQKPSILNDLRDEPNFRWMRRVTPQEAHNCLVRMSVWAESPITSRRAPSAEKTNRPLDERVYKQLQKWEVGLDREPGLELSETPWCAQYMWGDDFHFPCCPRVFGTDQVDDYLQALIPGSVFAISASESNSLALTVHRAMVHRRDSSLLVMCGRADGRWSIAGIEMDQRSQHFIHFYLGTYASKADADEAFRSKLDLENFWSDGYAGFQRMFRC